MSKNKWFSKLSKDLGQSASDLASSMKTKKIIPTLSVSLNWATTIGGFCPGKISILYGPESSGKTLIVMMGFAEIMRRDPEAICIWFDSEYSFNPAHFITLGGDPDRLLVRTSNDPTKIFDYIGSEVKELLQEGAPIRGIAIDSIKSIRYPKDNKKVTTDMTMGGTGSIYLPSALKLIIPVINEFNLYSFFIQQVTAQIDPMKAMRDPYTITEGHALKHAADIMIEVVGLNTKNGTVEDDKGRQIGHRIRVKVKKNRMGAPARKASFLFLYDTSSVGERENELFELAKSLGVIFHPTADGKTNNLIWDVLGFRAKGEPGVLQALKEKATFDKVLEACNSYVDKKNYKMDANGFIEEDDDSDEESSSIHADY